MAHSNQNLVPTVITDVNGRVTTVHKKMTAGTAQKKLPPPGIKKSPSKASRFRAIEEVLASSGRKFIKAKADNFLTFSKPAQLEVLDEVLSSFSSADPHEKKLIAHALAPLSSKNMGTSTIHDFLALRNAFSSEWAISNSPKETPFESYLLGLREDLYKPLDTSDPEVNKGTEAVLRFAYEVKSRAPYGGFLPVYSAQSGQDRNIILYVYDRPELATLIRENHDRVDEMIQYALDHQTCDPDGLWRFLNHDGPKPLTSGFL